MKKVKLSALLMLSTFALVSLFQVYWLRKLYADEWTSLRKEIDLLLRITVQDLQSKALHINPGLFFKPDTPNKFMEANMAEGRNPMPPFFGRPFPDSLKRHIKVSVQLKKDSNTVPPVLFKNKENFDVFSYKLRDNIVLVCNETEIFGSTDDNESDTIQIIDNKDVRLVKPTRRK